MNQKTNDEFSLINYLKKQGVYFEKGVGNKWCAKFSIPGYPLIIVTDEDEEICANLMMIAINNHPTSQPSLPKK